jgi:hypothetical protein
MTLSMKSDGSPIKVTEIDWYLSTRFGLPDLNIFSNIKENTSINQSIRILRIRTYARREKRRIQTLCSILEITETKVRNCRDASIAHGMPNINTIDGAVFRDVIFVFWITGRRSLLKSRRKSAFFYIMSSWIAVERLAELDPTNASGSCLETFCHFDCATMRATWHQLILSRLLCWKDQGRTKHCESLHYQRT